MSTDFAPGTTRIALVSTLLALLTTHIAPVSTRKASVWIDMDFVSTGTGLMLIDMNSRWGRRLALIAATICHGYAVKIMPVHPWFLATQLQASTRFAGALHISIVDPLESARTS